MGSNKVFGGVSLIAVGDLFQLKPVFDGWVFDDLRDDYGPLAINLWKEHFQYFCLSGIMRQKEDTKYAEILNRLRIESQTAEDIETLKSREMTEDFHLHICFFKIN